MPVGDSVPTDARVVATWVVIHLAAGGGGATIEMRERRSLQARVMPDGRFRLCGVPVNTELTIGATAADAESPEPEAVRIPPFMRYAQTDVGLARLAAGKAVLSGTVLVDSTAQPIAAADIMLPELGLATRSNESGAFRVGEIPAGDHRVVVRRLGYSPVETVVAFGSGQHVDRRFALARATILDSMRVIADATPRAMLSFEDHRRVGLGHFLDRADLAKVDALPMDVVLQSVAGARLARGHSSQASAVEAHNPFSGRRCAAAMLATGMRGRAPTATRASTLTVHLCTRDGKANPCSTSTRFTRISSRRSSITPGQRRRRASTVRSIRRAASSCSGRGARRRRRPSGGGRALSLVSPNCLC
jgi:hypothetical protein